MFGNGVKINMREKSGYFVEDVGLIKQKPAWHCIVFLVLLMKGERGLVFAWHSLNDS